MHNRERSACFFFAYFHSRMYRTVVIRFSLSFLKIIPVFRLSDKEFGLFPPVHHVRISPMVFNSFELGSNLKLRIFAMMIKYIGMINC